MPQITSFTVSTQAVRLDSSQPATFAREKEARNPAFSNLSAAAFAAGAKRNSVSILSAVLAVLLLAAIYAYLNQQQAPQAPVVVGPHINLTQMAQQDKNVTKQPVQQYVPKKNASTQPPNTSSQPPGNAGAPSGNQAQPSSAAPQAQQNNSSSSGSQGGQNGTAPPAGQGAPQQNSAAGAEAQQQFVRFSSFLSSEGASLEGFCQSMKGGLYRVAYTEYSGMDCRTYDDVQGYSVSADFPSSCSSVPCCYNAPSKQFSRLYESFECGFYS